MVGQRGSLLSSRVSHARPGCTFAQNARLKGAFSSFSLIRNEKMLAPRGRARGRRALMPHGHGTWGSLRFMRPRHTRMLRALEYCHVLLKLKPYAVPGLFRAPRTSQPHCALNFTVSTYFTASPGTPSHTCDGSVASRSSPSSSYHMLVDRPIASSTAVSARHPAASLFDATTSCHHAPARVTWPWPAPHRGSCSRCPRSS